MSGIGATPGSSNGGEYSIDDAPELREDQHAPEPAEAQGDPNIQQQAEARYAVSQFLLEPEPLPPTDNPPAFNDTSNSRRVEYTPTLREQRAAQQAGSSRRREERPPTFGEHTNTPTENPANDPALRPRPSTNSLRRMISSGTLRSQASTASLQSSAPLSRTGSRVNLRQDSGGGDVPPVPPLPAAFRRGTGSEVHSEPPPAYENNAAAGSSTGPGTLAAASGTAASGSRFRLGSLFSTPLRDPQGATNHALRDLAKKGKSDDLNRALDATNPAPNPATPSSVSRQNAFHKVGLSSAVYSEETVNKLFEKTPIGLRASAAKQQDKYGNTPLHYVEKKIGAIEDDPIRSNELRRLNHLASSLRTAAGKTGDPGEIDRIQNNVNQTPTEARTQARHKARADRDPFRSAGLI